MSIKVTPFFPVFTDIDGQPLENGKIYVGLPNVDTVANPVTVFWDEALTVPATQPIATIGGYPSNAGVASPFYASQPYSLVVQNKNGTQVHSAPSAAEVGSPVSVKDYGAQGDGSTDDTSSIQAAINAVGAAGGGTVYFPSGTYKITTTLFVRYNGVTLAGDSEGSTTIGAGTDFVGSGGSIPNTMVQFNDHTAAGKLFHLGMRDLTINSIAFTAGPGSNPEVTCLFHANWVHYMNVERCTFYGASTGSDGIGALLTAVGPAFSEEFSMLNSFTDCEFTYNYHGMKFGVTGQGSINASQVYRCRFGGTAVGTGTGIEIRGGTYGNSFVDNDIEIYGTGIDASDTVAYFRGNLAEQNSLDFTGGLGSQLFGNEFNIVSSDEPGMFVQEHGIVRNLMVEKTAPNLIVDPQFNTKLYQSTFLNTSVVPKTGDDEIGKYTLQFPGGASVTNRARILLNNKDQTLNGWYTFVLRAKADVAGGGLYVRIPTPLADPVNDVRFAAIKSGTSYTLELLEANSHTFVAGQNRSGVLATDYKIYFGSIYYSNQAISELELRLTAQDAGGGTIPTNFTVDYFGMFEGLTGFVPGDDRVLEKYTDVSAVASGGSAIITKIPFSDDVFMKATSVLTGAVSRSINDMNLNVQNGVAAPYVYHYDLNTFGYNAGGSSGTSDHIYVNSSAELLYFSRTASLAGTDPLYTKIYFYQ
jgi:hypothetical protein